MWLPHSMPVAHLVEPPELAGASAAVGRGEQLRPDGGQAEWGGVREGEAADALGDLPVDKHLAADNSAGWEALGARNLRGSGRGGGRGWAIESPSSSGRGVGVSSSMGRGQALWSAVGVDV